MGGVAMSELNLRENKFLTKAKGMSHGFAAILGKNNTDALTILWVCNDSFSCYHLHKNEVFIMVQAGALSEESATRIYKSYIKGDAGYVPPRNTDGSFLIFDSRNQRFFIGRDRSQAYHMYMSMQGDQLYLSTNAQPFLGSVCRGLDPVGCDLYLSSGATVAPFPILKDISALLPGEYLQAGVKDFSTPLSLKRVRTFWQIDPVDIPDDYNVAVSRYGDLLTGNIERHLENQSAGVFLSGGSDSAAVVGALHKLKCPKVVAGHLSTPGFFDVEKSLVGELQKSYNFQLELLSPDSAAQTWISEMDSAILANPTGPFLSDTAMRQLGCCLGNILPNGTPIFNGEMCLLDQGFNTSEDASRSFRRWLYMKNGRLLSKAPKLSPDIMRGRWTSHRSSAPRQGAYRQMESILTAVLSVVYAIGRPAHYFAGAKVGFMGLPGIWGGRSYLGGESNSDIVQLLYEQFFSKYESRLGGAEWRQAFATMTTCWYSEAANFTNPLSGASAGKLAISFPFSSVDLMDFATACPVPWCVDKKIQKDMCSQVLSMPHNVAYFLKCHKISGKNYFEHVYSTVQEHMVQRIKNTDYGVLQPEINRRLSITFENMNLHGLFLFYPYALSILKEAVEA